MHFACKGTNFTCRISKCGSDTDGDVNEIIGNEEKSEIFWRRECSATKKQLFIVNIGL